MEDSLDDEDDMTMTNLGPGSQVPDLTAMLRRELINHTVDRIADDIVAKCGSSNMKRVNNALTAWRVNWDARRTQDAYVDKTTFFSHPLTFWRLAKLYVVLHFFRHQSGQDSELFAFSARSGEAGAKIHVQLQVIQWLWWLRQQKDGQQLATESFLSQVIN